MDKNTTTGFILIALVLIAFSYFNRPSAEEQRAAFVQDSIAQVARINAEKKQKAEAAAKAAEAKQKAEEDTTALFHNALKGSAENTFNSIFDHVFSNWWIMHETNNLFVFPIFLNSIFDR